MTVETQRRFIRSMRQSSHCKMTNEMPCSVRLSNTFTLANHFLLSFLQRPCIQRGVRELDMNSSFLVHVPKKIPRSQLNRGLAALNGSKLSSRRPFSTQPCVTLWGSQAKSLGLDQKGGSVFIALQPIRSAAALRRHVSTVSMQLREQDPSDDPAAGSMPGDNTAAGNHGGSNSNGGDGDDKSGRSAFNVIDNQLQKPTVPEVYPQVLAVPIARRPLFPGFYKAVVVKDPNVTAAIKDLMKRGQPYVGAFLLKDEMWM